MATHVLQRLERHYIFYIFGLQVLQCVVSRFGQSITPCCPQSIGVVSALVMDESLVCSDCCMGLDFRNALYPFLTTRFNSGGCLNNGWNLCEAKCGVWFGDDS